MAIQPMTRNCVANVVETVVDKNCHSLPARLFKLLSEITAASSSVLLIRLRFCAFRPKSYFGESDCEGWFVLVSVA